MRPAAPVQPVVLVLGGLTVAASLGAAVVLYQRYGDPDVQSGTRGYVVESDALVRVEFEVAKDPGATALCTVRAQDRTGAEAGVALVRVGPADTRRVVVVHPLPTTSRATTGEVTGCSLAPGAGGAP